MIHRLQTQGVHCCDRCVHTVRVHMRMIDMSFSDCKTRGGLKRIMFMAHYTRKLRNYRWFCSFFLSITRIVECLQYQQLLDFVITLWCIRKRRNDKLCNNVETQPQILVHMAHVVISQRQQVRTR